VTVSGGRPHIIRLRDLLYWIDGETAYVLACDSNAGIGRRPADRLDKSPVEVGYSAAKVPLMEILASGATPFLLTDALGGPLDEYGRQVLAGIEAALAEIDADVTLTGSDETNIPTRQTALGVTVLGRTHRSVLRLGTTEPGDAVVAVGRPKDGLLVAYSEGEPEIAGLRDLQAAARLAGVHELLPVGSHGIAYEAGQLAAGIGGRLDLVEPAPLDLTASAGASTCFLVALPPSHVPDLQAALRPPVAEIGRVRQ
jgi:hypothetical protein